MQGRTLLVDGNTVREKSQVPGQFRQAEARTFFLGRIRDPDRVRVGTFDPNNPSKYGSRPHSTIPDPSDRDARTSEVLYNFLKQPCTRPCRPVVHQSTLLVSYSPLQEPRELEKGLNLPKIRQAFI